MRQQEAPPVRGFTWAGGDAPFATWPLLQIAAESRAFGTFGFVGQWSSTLHGPRAHHKFTATCATLPCIILSHRSVRYSINRSHHQHARHSVVPRVAPMSGIMQSSVPASSTRISRGDVWQMASFLSIVSWTSVCLHSKSPQPAVAEIIPYP